MEEIKVVFDSRDWLVLMENINKWLQSDEVHELMRNSSKVELKIKQS